MGVENEKIKVEYTGTNVPPSVKNFMPDVYLDGEEYYCVLGVGTDQISGRGPSIEEAMKSWDRAFREKKGS